MQVGTSDMTQDNILHSINARLLDNVGNWATNLKCMIIFHRMMQEKLISMVTFQGCKKLGIAFQVYEKSKGKESNGNYFELFK